MPRDHDTFVADGKRNEDHDALLRQHDARRKKIFKKDSPYKETGVKEQSPLRFLPFFCLVWDILPDMMHIILGIFKRHLVAMLKGGRPVAPVKVRKKFSAKENKALLSAHEECKKNLATWKLSPVNI